MKTNPILSFAVLALVGALCLPPSASALAPPGETGSPPKAAQAKAKSKANTSSRARTTLGRARYLVGAEVHTAEGTIIQDGVIEIRGDTIAAVGGPEARGRIPAGAEVVDLSGKIITPGLIAADTSLGLVEIGAEKSTRDGEREEEHPIRSGYDPSTAINAFSSLIPVQAVEGITTAAVAPSGGLLSGQVTWIDLTHGDRERMVAASRIAVDGAAGRRHAGSRAATLHKLRQVLEDAQFYRRTKGAYDRGQSRKLAARPGDLQALQPALAGRVPLTISADRASDILALLDLARSFRLKLVIVGGAQAWKVAKELAAANVPVILTPSSNLPRNFDSLGARLDNAAILARAGVNVVIAEIGGAHNVRNIVHQAGIAIANGLPAEEALAAITINVAEAYGMADRYGSIRAGKVANLVVWDSDPFELDSWPRQVFIQGKPIPMATRQTLLRDRYLEQLGLLPQ